jgi:hypothetical protein
MRIIVATNNTHSENYATVLDCWVEKFWRPLERQWVFAASGSRENHMTEGLPEDEISVYEADLRLVRSLNR